MKWENKTLLNTVILRLIGHDVAVKVEYIDHYSFSGSKLRTAWANWSRFSIFNKNKQHLNVIINTFLHHWERNH